MELKDIAQTLEDQGKAFEAFKTANDKLIAAKAEGKAVGDLTAEVEKLSAELDKLAEVKTAIEELQKKANRPDVGTDDASKALAQEVKSFNIALRGDLQLRGKSLAADFDAKTYSEYKSGFLKLAAGARLEHLTDDEQKAMQAGSDPDGGYFLPHSTTGRVVTKLFEQSIMRQICDVQTISTAKMDGLIDNNEAGAGWVSELGTRSDSSTPQIGKWEIEAHEMYAMPKASQKTLDDAATDVEAWLAGKVADKFARVGICAGDNHKFARAITARVHNGRHNGGVVGPGRNGGNTHQRVNVVVKIVVFHGVSFRCLSAPELCPGLGLS